MPPDAVAAPLTSASSTLAAASVDAARMPWIARVGAALGRSLRLHASSLP